MKERLSTIGAARLDWAELDAAVAKIRQETLYARDWSKIDDSFTRGSIDILVQSGWKLFVDFRGPGAFCSPVRKEIGLPKSLGGFERDTALFHELVHAWFGDELNDAARRYFMRERQNNRITEWLARKLRAKPELLRHAVTTFGLEPVIYDSSSYLAFSLNLKELENFKSGLQPALPLFEHLAEERFAEIMSKIQME